MVAPFGGKSVQKCRKPVPNTTDRQLKTLNGDEPQRAKTFRRAAAAPPSRRAATTHIALPRHAASRCRLSSLFSRCITQWSSGNSYRMCSSCTRLVKGLAVEFEQLCQIDAIARTGTFSAAAEALHTSQPSVSRSMRALERELGCELFNRSRNHVELNEAGELALKHARAILAEERRMHDAFDDLTRTNRTLNVASVAPAPVWRLASRVTERFPGTMLTSETIDDEQEVERRLFDRSADLAITRRPIGLPNVVCVPFMVENLFIYAPATDPIAQQTSIRLADLDGRTFLMNADVGFWGDMTRAALPNARIIMQQDSNVLAQLIRTSDVLGFVTDVSEFNHPDENRVRVPIQDADAHATFYVVAMIDAPQSVLDIVEAVRR